MCVFVLVFVLVFMSVCVCLCTRVYMYVYVGGVAAKNDQKLTAGREGSESLNFEQSHFLNNP